MNVSDRYRHLATQRDLAQLLQESADQKRRDQLDLTSTYVAPFTEAEVAVSGIWQRVLNLDEVGVTDNFFELGGDSLHITLVLNTMYSDLGIEIPIEEFFEGPTIRELVSHASTTPDTIDTDRT
jgi:acyl carrier protein